MYVQYYIDFSISQLSMKSSSNNKHLFVSHLSALLVVDG